jgi:hypothetical protein
MLTTPNRKKAHFSLAVKKGAKLFLDCFDAVREHKQCWNKWIATNGWIDRYDFLTNLKFVAADLKKLVSVGILNLDIV